MLKRLIYLLIRIDGWLTRRPKSQSHCAERRRGTLPQATGRKPRIGRHYAHPTRLMSVGAALRDLDLEGYEQPEWPTREPIEEFVADGDRMFTRVSPPDKLPPVVVTTPASV